MVKNKQPRPIPLLSTTVGAVAAAAAERERALKQTTKYFAEANKFLNPCKGNK